MKEVVIEIGKCRIERTKDGEYHVKTPGKLSRDDLIHLASAIQQLFDEEQQEILEEKKAKGIKTYVEYRGEQVVAEY